MSALRSMGLPAALLAATGGVAFATWRYFSARRQNNAEHGGAGRVVEEENVEVVSALDGEEPDISLIGERYEEALTAGTTEAVSPVQHEESRTGSQGSDENAAPGTSPVRQEEKRAAPVTSVIQEEKKSAAAPVTSVIQEEKKSAAAPVTLTIQKEKKRSAAPVTSVIQEEKKSAAAPVTSVIQEEKKSAAAPVTSITAEEKSAPVTSIIHGEEKSAFSAASQKDASVSQDKYHKVESLTLQEQSNTSSVQTKVETPKSPRSSVDLPVEKGISDTVSSPEIQHKEKHAPCRQVLVLGLDGSGKTSILNSIAANKGKPLTTPTEGVYALCVSNGNSKMEFLEIGGSEQFRPYWKMYLSKAFAVIFVVDSADHGRLPLAKRHLHQLIQQDSVLPLIVLANKQDLQNAHHIPEIHDALALSEICENRKLFLIGTYVTKDDSEISSGIQDTKEFLAQLLLENSAEIK